jgi:hypothetical protein
MSSQGQCGHFADIAINALKGYEYDGSVPLDVAALLEYCLEEIRLIIQWSLIVPGFKSLCVEDRKALLYSSFMELSFLRLAFR